MGGGNGEHFRWRTSEKRAEVEMSMMFWGMTGLLEGVLKTVDSKTVLSPGRGES